MTRAMLKRSPQSMRRTMNLNLKQVFAPILRWRMRDNRNARAETDVVALPLTHQELTVVMDCICMACEFARTEATDKQTISLIRERIVRFAERQGAWWDMEGEIVTTVVKTMTPPASLW
jgi:hypothetical protein